MSNRITLWPPEGGDPITIYEIDAERLISNGWTKEEPSSKPKAKSKDRAANKAEEAK